ELAAYDHWSQQVTLVANAFLPEAPDDETVDAAWDDCVGRLARMAADGATPLDEPLVVPPVASRGGSEDAAEVTSTMSGGAYEQAVEAAREYVLAGDAFQIVLAQRFDLTTTAEPLDLYRTLRQVN